MHKNATKCNETICKWCKNKHGASKIIDTFETYQHHAGSRSLIAEVFQHTFLWLTVHVDAKGIMRRCLGYKNYANQAHMSASSLKMIPLAWPFTIWGIDMLRSIKRNRSGLTHLLVAVDKFTKWVETKSIRNINIQL
jgi:hypothetical protein